MCVIGKEGVRMPGPSSRLLSLRLSWLLALSVALSGVRTARADTTTRLLPIVLDVYSGTAHFTTELCLTNAERNAVGVPLRYAASLGSGSGIVSDSLTGGRQLVILRPSTALNGRKDQCRK
jgi:hypothetical protein